jgi:hypothetical protein
MNRKNISIWATLLVVCVWQSYGVSAAACGTYASIGPDPVIAMKNIPTISITSLGGSTLLYHGNSDGTCDDAYVRSYLTVSTTTSEELSYWKASEFIYGCVARLGNVCSVARLVPFYNPRQGAWKTSMISTTPNRAWSAPSAAASTSFSLQILAGTSSYTTLAAAAYTFQISVSSHRTCLVREQQFSGAQITVSAGALTVTVAASLSVALYSVCMQVIRSGSTLATWFPLSAALGHSAHNLPIGLPSTDVTWSLDSTPTGGSRLLYGDNLTFYVENQAVTDGWTYFAVDTSADVCSPLLANQIQSTSLSAFNATHMRGYLTVPRPLGSPGGGDAVLCGSRGVSAPWQLISTRSTQTVYYCPVGYYTQQRSPNFCAFCLPNVSAQCNNRGTCGVVETKTYYALQVTCSCNSAYYGDACQYTQVPTPVASVTTGTFRVRHLYVSVTIVSWANDLRVVFDATATEEIFGGNTTLVFSETGGFSATARLSDGSESQTPCIGYFIIEVPTPTHTHSATATVSLSDNSASTSSSDTASPSESEEPSLSKSRSQSKGTATEEVSASETITPPPTHTSTSTLTAPQTPTLSGTESVTSSISRKPPPTRTPSEELTSSETQHTASSSDSSSFTGSASTSLLQTQTPSSTDELSYSHTESASGTYTSSGTYSAAEQSVSPSSTVKQKSRTAPLPTPPPTRNLRLTPDDYKTPLDSDDPIRIETCVESQCTEGLVFNCTTLFISAQFVVPRQHRCVITTIDSTNVTTLHVRDVTITPRSLQSRDLWPHGLDGVPRFVFPRFYRVSPLPCLWNSTTILMSLCKDPAWSPSPFFVSVAESCISFKVSAPGFEGLTGFLFLPRMNWTSDLQTSPESGRSVLETGTIEFDTALKRALPAGASMVGIAVGIFLIFLTVWFFHK